MIDEYYVICKNCQARNPLSNDFCNNCGEKLVKNSDISNGLITIFHDTDDDEHFVGSGSSLTTSDNEDAKTVDSKHKQLGDEPKKSFCPNCGNEVVSGAKFCPSCGFKLNDDTERVTIENNTSTSDTQSRATSTNASSHPTTGNGFVSLIVVAILFIVAVSGYVIYRHVTYLPKGDTKDDTVILYSAESVTGVLKAYIEFIAPSVANSSSYAIVLYKNDRTGNYVFPIESQKSGKKHYCYLFKVVSLKTGYVAVDIDNEHWSEFAGNKKNSEFKIIGNNNPIWDRKMSVPYYVNHFTTGNIN